MTRSIEYPRAPVIRSRRHPNHPDWRTVIVGCPLCRKQHLHGERNGLRGNLGYRVAHCSQYTGNTVRGYVVWDMTPLNRWEIGGAAV